MPARGGVKEQGEHIISPSPDSFPLGHTSLRLGSGAELAGLCPAPCPSGGTPRAAEGGMQRRREGGPGAGHGRAASGCLT